MDKNQAITSLSEIVGDFVFKDRLPQEFQGDKSKLSALATHFNKAIITSNVVNQVISDLSFTKVLEKVEHEGEKYKGEVALKNITEIDSKTIASQAYEILSSLPIEYQFILRLPKCETTIKSIKFTHNVEIVSADEAFIKHLFGEQDPEKKLRSLLSDYTSEEQRLSKGDVVLRVGGKGYVSDYSAIKLNIIDPLYIWKAIIGVYAGLEIIQRREKVTYIRVHPEFTYDVHLNTGEHIRSFNESTEDNQYISRMRFDPDVFKPTKLDTLLKKTNTPFDYANDVLTNLFSKIKFAEGKTDKNVVKQQRMIKNGAYWFYESLKTQQDHIRVIYMTTSFDSLLGAKGNDATKENKAEIISISVSKDSLEAHSIRETIIELYALRNEIIHGSREISSLDQYGDLDEKPTKAKMYYSLSILARFLKSRIYFVNGGLARVSKVTRRV